jgi:nicotinate-nucleotide--dimethylbenzimidazole phosphoribosyltransferase
VSDSLPDEVIAVVERIAAPDGVTAEVPSDVTGVLADLLRWWQAMSPGAAPVPAHVHVEPADSAVDAVLAGIRAADRAIDAGSTLLVPTVDDRDDVAARTVISLLTRREASAVVGQPTGMTDRAWMQLCTEVRDRSADAAERRGEPLALLEALGATRMAFVAGVLLATAARRTPCLIDGTDELAAALVADRISYRAKAWWRAGSDSPDPGRAAAMDRIDLPRGLPLALTDDAGRGSAATLALLDLLV